MGMSHAAPYLGNLSLALRTRLHNSISKNLLFCKIKVIFKSTTRLNFFCFQDKVPFNLRSTAVKDHTFFCDHIVSLDDFKTLASSNSQFHINIKESLLISRDKPELNRNEKYLPLYIFD